jgi:formylglycine-generating enzyme required for sulfatase activity
MVVIPEGSFMMGSPEKEQGRNDDEGPPHWVTLKRFALARTEVTVAEFRRFVEASGYRTDAEKNTGSAKGCITYQHRTRINPDWAAGKSWRDPGFPQQDDHPVVCISWNDAQAYVGWLSKPGKEYRLPSEAEFEYVLRAGGDSAWPWGDDVSAACTHGNVADRQAEQLISSASWLVVDCDDKHVFTAPAGRYRGNGYGVYDLTGNTTEWAQDCWNGNYVGAPADGLAWMTGDCGNAVLRGGSWIHIGPFLRSASRSRGSRDYRNYVSGFRPVRSVTP